MYAVVGKYVSKVCIAHTYTLTYTITLYDLLLHRGKVRQGIFTYRVGKVDIRSHLSSPRSLHILNRAMVVNDFHLGFLLRSRISSSLHLRLRFLKLHLTAGLARNSKWRDRRESDRRINGFSKRFNWPQGAKSTRETGITIRWREMQRSGIMINH